MREGSCSETGCQYEATGVCLNGFVPPTKCPHFISTPDESEDEEDSDDLEDAPLSASGAAGSSSNLVSEADLGQIAPPTSDAVIEISRGLELTEDESRHLALAESAIYVVLAGAVDCGKTTLLAGLFEQFQEGPYAGFNFAGSRCLLAWEHRCHTSRTASQNTTPSVFRTAIGAIPYLHIAVATERKQSLSNLLIADMSGELYEAASHSNEAVEQLTILRTADHFVLLLDGSTLLTDSFREAAAYSAFSLMDRLSKSNIFPKNTALEVVISKWDEVACSEEADRVEVWWNDLQATFLRSFGATFPEITYYLLATVSYCEKVPDAYGLDQLLLKWATPPHRINYQRMAPLGDGRHMGSFVSRGQTF